MSVVNKITSVYRSQRQETKTSCPKKIAVKGKAGNWKWDLLYHDFEAQSGGADFGQEIDAALSRKFAKHYGVLFKAAWFDGARNSGYADTTKIWVQLTAGF